MNINENDINLFDDYISQNLTNKEVKDFENRLISDPEFHSNWEEYQLFNKNINLSVDKYIKDEIKEAENKYFNELKIKKRIITIAFIFVCLTSLYFIFNHKVKKETTHTNSPKNEVSIPTETLEKEIAKEEKDTTNAVDPKQIPLKEINKTNFKSTSTTKEKKEEILPAAKKTPPINVKSFTELSISKKVDTFEINSPNKINDITIFTKNKTEYIIVDHITYKSSKNGFKAINDNRFTELLHRCSGKGRSTIVNINYKYFEDNEGNTYPVTFDLIRSAEFNYKNKIFSYKEIMNLETHESKVVIPRFFTAEDIIEMEMSN